MYSFESLDMLNTLKSFRLKNIQGQECGGLFCQLGLSSLNRFRVTGRFEDSKDDRGEHRLLEGSQRNVLLSTQNGIVHFSDINQRPVLSMEFKSNRKGFLWHQNQMELQVSMDGLVLGKVIHCNPLKDTYTIHDFSGPNTYYDIEKSDPGKCGTVNNYSIYRSLPTNLQSSELIARISQDDEFTTEINFEDTKTSQSLSSQAKALLLGLMLFMTSTAPGKLTRQIHNEAAYKASTLLLY